MKPLSVAAILAFSIAAALGSASANAVNANVEWNRDDARYYLFDEDLSPLVIVPGTRFAAFGELTVASSSGGGYDYELLTVIPRNAFVPATASAADNLGVDPSLLIHPEYGIFDFGRSWVSYLGADGTEYLTLAQIRESGGDFSLLADGNISLSWSANYRITGINFEYLNPVPEPETWAMLLAGLGIVGATARRRKP